VRREHSRLTGEHQYNTAYQAQRFVDTLSDLGSAFAEKAEEAIKQATAVLPGWYQKRIYELIHINIPRHYARRFYNVIVGHQAIMSKHEDREVSIEEAAHDWYERYHLPTILMLRQRLTQEQDPMQAYFAIMQHKWNMSIKAGSEVPLDEAILDWGMQQAQTGKLGSVDPASIATWWHQRESVANVLEPNLIGSDELDPLLSTAEKPLVHLKSVDLEQQLPKILERSTQSEKKDEEHR
jgi:hypothetical protein